MARVQSFSFALPSDGDRPFYKSLARAIRDSISAGILSEGESLPTQDEIARAAGVNVGTVSRAINLLLRERVLTKRSNGDRVRVASPGGHSDVEAVQAPAAPSETRLRLRAMVQTVAIYGDTAEIRLVIARDQDIVITTTSTRVEGLGLREGQPAMLEIPSAQTGLSSS